MTSTLPENDRCQVTRCSRTNFTYCPHCKLFVCIDHLNEHYANYRQEYRSLLVDFQNENVLNRRILLDIEEEKRRWTRICHNQSEFLRSQEFYLNEKNTEIHLRPHDCAELRLRLEQSKQRREKIMTYFECARPLFHQFEKSLHQLVIGSSTKRVQNEENSAVFAQFSIDYHDIESDDESVDEVKTKFQRYSNRFDDDESKLESRKNDEKFLDTISSSTVSEDFDDGQSNSNEDFSTNKKFYHSKENSSLKPKRIVNHFRVNLCPFNGKLYGIDLTKHRLQNMPCLRANIGSISLLTHLRIRHCLNSKASLHLTRHIMKNGSENEVNLFSNWNDSLVDILPKSFRGRCPLTRLGVFGLNEFHNIRLCDENQIRDDTGLLNHFVIFHCLSYPWANRLCNAMLAGDHDGTKQILFEPNEPIKAEKWLTKTGEQILQRRSLKAQARAKKSNKTQ